MKSEKYEVFIGEAGIPVFSGLQLRGLMEEKEEEIMKLQNREKPGYFLPLPGGK